MTKLPVMLAIVEGSIPGLRIQDLTPSTFGTGYRPGLSTTCRCHEAHQPSTTSSLSNQYSVCYRLRPSRHCHLDDSSKIFKCCKVFHLSDAYLNVRDNACATPDISTVCTKRGTDLCNPRDLFSVHRCARWLPYLEGRDEKKGGEKLCR